MDCNPNIHIPMQRKALSFHINEILKAVKESKDQLDQKIMRRHDMTIVQIARYKGMLNGIANKFMMCE